MALKKYLTEFNTYADYQEFLESSECPYVNTSYIVEDDSVEYFKDQDAINDWKLNTPLTIKIAGYNDPMPSGESVNYDWWNEETVYVDDTEYKRFVGIDYVSTSTRPTDEDHWLDFISSDGFHVHFNTNDYKIDESGDWYKENIARHIDFYFDNPVEIEDGYYANGDDRRLLAKYNDDVGAPDLFLLRNDCNMCNWDTHSLWIAGGDVTDPYETRYRLELLIEWCDSGKYSINGGEWNELPTCTWMDQHKELWVENLQIGDEISIIAHKRSYKQETERYGSSWCFDETIINNWQIDRKNKWSDEYYEQSGKFDLYGNILSCVYEDRFIEASKDLPKWDKSLDGDVEWDQKSGIFTNAFPAPEEIRMRLRDCSDLWLPTRTMPVYAFARMFYGCKNIRAVPDLKSTYATPFMCYQMFAACHSLQTMPTINIKQVSVKGLAEMFNSCYSLRNTTPLLINKFVTNLNVSSEWDTTYAYWLTPDIAEGMFRYCNSMITAPIFVQTITLENYNPGDAYGYKLFTSMFAGCEGLEDASTIHLTFKEGFRGYNLRGITSNMFNGCFKLITGPYIDLRWYKDYMIGMSNESESMFEECNNLGEFTFLAKHMIPAEENNFFNIPSENNDGTWYYDADADYNPYDYVPEGWTCEPVESD